MQPPRLNPVKTLANLRTRVDSLLRIGGAAKAPSNQLDFVAHEAAPIIAHPSANITEFLDFIIHSLPGGELYLFGGVLRDLALYGRRGFHSDIDLVVEGDWEHCVRYLQSAGARLNKFGGFRMTVAGWPIDIWNARDTWAIRNGFVRYEGISSLTLTTIVNWDAILMNWRTGRFVSSPRYLDDIRERCLDIVLPDNPNPLGAATRVFRHICMKDARRISSSTAVFLSRAAGAYSYAEIRAEELRSFGAVEIAEPVYRLFQHVGNAEAVTIGKRFGIAVELLRRELDLQ